MFKTGMLKTAKHWNIKENEIKGEIYCVPWIGVLRTRSTQTRPDSFQERCQHNPMWKELSLQQMALKQFDSHMLNKQNLTSNLPSHHILKIYTKGITDLNIRGKTTQLSVECIREKNPVTLVYTDFLDDKIMCHKRKKILIELHQN